MFLARVPLGEPFLISEEEKFFAMYPNRDNIRIPPKQRNRDELCDSVVALTPATSGHPQLSSVKLHREFVLYDNFRSYPEFIIHYRWSKKENPTFNDDDMDFNEASAKKDRRLSAGPSAAGTAVEKEHELMKMPLLDQQERSTLSDS